MVLTDIPRATDQLFRIDAHSFRVVKRIGNELEE